MKLKLLFFAALVFGMVQTSNAQGFALGVKGGANFGKIDGQSFKNQFKTGYQVGGFATIPLGPTFGIQPEVLFNQTNTKISDNPGSVISFDNMQNVQLKELLIPILLNINVVKILSLQVGPQFGVVMDQDKNMIENGKDAFKSGNFSVAAGAQLNLSNFRIFGRFTTGVNNMNNVSLNDFRNDESWKVQNIQVGVGISLF